MALTPKTLLKPFSQGGSRDSNHILVGAFGSFVTTDATGTPQVSPITVSSSVINLVVPDNATQLVLSNNANALRISEVSTVTGNYYVLPASTSNFVIDVARMTNVYLLQDSASVTVQFMFIIN